MILGKHAIKKWKILWLCKPSPELICISESYLLRYNAMHVTGVSLISVYLILILNIVIKGTPALKENSNPIFN